MAASKTKKTNKGGRPRSRVPRDLADPIATASTADELLAALKAVAVAAIKGDADRTVGRLLIELSREMRQTLRIKALEPRPSEVAQAVEILTADEAEVVDRTLEAYRASHRTRPLKPGEAVPPPPGEDAGPRPTDVTRSGHAGRPNA